MIVNADDLGFSPGVTDGIFRAHHEGIVTSATLACNMPFADEAVNRLFEAPNLGVGVHLNVSQGPALSPAGKRHLVGEGGVMNRSARAVISDVIARRWLLDVYEEEFDAQIRWALDHGVRVTHLDSHRHSHAFPPVFMRVSRLARRYDIRHIRRHGEGIIFRKLTGGAWKQTMLSGALSMCSQINTLLDRTHVRTVRGTLGVADTGRIDARWLVETLRTLRWGVTEIMTHPGLADDIAPSVSRLRESRHVELEALCDASVKEAVRRYEVELINYGSL